MIRKRLPLPPSWETLKIALIVICLLALADLSIFPHDAIGIGALVAIAIGAYVGFTWIDQHAADGETTDSEA